MREEAEQRQLIAAYWKHYALSKGGRHQRFEASQSLWAWEEVQRAVQAPSASAVELVTALVESAADDDALGYIGAGPLEDLITPCRTRTIS